MLLLLRSKRGTTRVWFGASIIDAAGCAPCLVAACAWGAMNTGGRSGDDLDGAEQSTAWVPGGMGWQASRNCNYYKNNSLWVARLFSPGQRSCPCSCSGAAGAAATNQCLSVGRSSVCVHVLRIFADICRCAALCTIQTVCLALAEVVILIRVFVCPYCAEIQLRFWAAVLATADIAAAQCTHLHRITHFRSCRQVLLRPLPGSARTSIPAAACDASCESFYP